MRHPWSTSFLKTSHAAQEARQAFLQPGQTHSKAKFDPPKLSAGSDQETWNYFLRDWDQYKATMVIVGDKVKLFIAEVNSMTNQQLIEAVKSLAVKVESKLIHSIRMGEATQPPDTGIRNLVVRPRQLGLQPKTPHQTGLRQLKCKFIFNIFLNLQYGRGSHNVPVVEIIDQRHCGL